MVGWWTWWRNWCGSHALQPHAVQLINRYSERKEAAGTIDPATELPAVITARDEVAADGI